MSDCCYNFGLPVTSTNRVRMMIESIQKDFCCVGCASADIVVLKATLNPIVEAVQLSKRTQTIIKQNITFALLYNAFMVPLAMMAKITPLFAAIVMPISSIIVIANAARLRKNQE